MLPFRGVRESRDFSRVEVSKLNMPKTRGEIKMTKKISKKELKKFKEQMGISDIRHNRPPVGRPAVFVGVTSKRRRREGKKEVRDYD